MTRLPKANVAELFEGLSYLDVFFNSGTVYAEGGVRLGWGTIRIDEKALNGFLSVESVKELLGALIEPTDISLKHNFPSDLSETPEVNSANRPEISGDDRTPLNRLRTVADLD